MKPFKEYHLLQFLNQWDFITPLDLAISLYFRQHKSLGSKDRKFIAETTYGMIRELALVDYFIKGPINWESRYHVFKDLDIQKARNNLTIPVHVRCSAPEYLFSKLKETFGEKSAYTLSLRNNQRAPLTVRVNELKTTRDAFYEKMKSLAPLSLCKRSPVGVRFNEHVNLFQTNEFKEGHFEVQDEGSQLVSFLVNAQPKQKVLDYCAGSGGKTLAFAPKMQGQGCIFVHDIRASIIGQAKKRLKRAGVQNYQIAEPGSKNLKALYKNMDWVLVDVPCTGTGTYRRSPDLKWKFDEKMLQETVQKQREIFHEALKYLKPSGRIVYATCSLLKDENEDQVEFFKSKYGLKTESNPLNSAIDFGSMDGFYGAVLTPS